MKEILNRFKSPVTWLAIVGLVYTTILVPKFDLPDWSQVVGYVAVIFGITNNPSDRESF